MATPIAPGRRAPALKEGDEPGLAPAEARRGPGGRPTREEAERRHRVLLDTAARLFVAGGLNGTSIDAIAEEAGVAKRFIYARYADKGELFVAAIGRFIEERLAPFGYFEPPAAPAEPALVEFGRRLLHLALQPEPLAVYRILATEAWRFPNLATAFIRSNRERIMGGLVRMLQAHAQRGEIELADPQMTAEHFFILVAGIAQRFALVGVREEPAQAERRLKAAVSLFLDGCRKRQEPQAATETKASPGPA